MCTEHDVNTFIYTERDAGHYLKCPLKLSILYENTNVLANFHTTLQYQIYSTSSSHSLLFSSCYMHTDGQMDIWYNDFNSHSTSMHTCLKTAWKIWSQVRKWKFFTNTGVFMFYKFQFEAFFYFTQILRGVRYHWDANTTYGRQMQLFVIMNPYTVVNKHTHLLMSDE
jgi:hypothetical protein